MTRKQAKALALALERLREEVDDSIASEAADAYPTLKGDNRLISAGTRINHNGSLKRAAVDLWDRTENNPDNAPSLWEDISYRDGIRIIPETISQTGAFMKGDYGWWKEELYISVIDSNVWSPDAYPDGWERQNNE